MEYTQPVGRRSPLIVLVVAGLALLVGSLATPFTNHGHSVFDNDGGAGAKLLAVVGIPMLLAALASGVNEVIAGIAGGIAMFVGVALGFVWALSLALITMTDSPYHPSVGLFFMIGSSAAFICAAIVSRREHTRPTPATSSPVAMLGVLATLLTAIGSMIPPHHAHFDDWMGYKHSGWIGVISFGFIATFVYVGVAGFRGGRWGLGLVAGFVGEMLFGNLTADNQDGLLSTVFRSDLDWHPLAKIGFWATVVLLAIHFVQQLATSSGPALAGAANVSSPGASVWSSHASTPASTGDNPPRWADDPFGRHQHRFWNGHTWTDHVANNGVTSSDPAEHRPPQPPAAWQDPSPY